MQRVLSVTRWLAVLVGACVVRRTRARDHESRRAGDACADARSARRKCRKRWQSLQTDFHGDERLALHCVGQVTLAVGDRAICYEGADDRWCCAGTIYTVGFGTTFTIVGVDDVDQVSAFAVE